MRRYVVDYTNEHDLSVCDTIMSPSYRFQIGGDSYDFSEYKSMVRKAFERFPDLRLTVHEICWSGHRIAMRFSESATSPRHGGARAVWPGVALYRIDGEGRLASCVVNQDFHGRHEQLVSGAPMLEEPPHPHPWTTHEGEPNMAGEAAARSWLAGEEQVSPEQTTASVTIDDELPPLLSRREVRVVDLFSAGDFVAASLSIHGEYSGGLAEVDDDAIGTSGTLGATALLYVTERRIDRVHLVADRYGLRRRLQQRLSG